MKRRGFLGALAASAAAFALDPERALWVPGAKTISVPKTGDTIRIQRPVRFTPCLIQYQRDYNRILSMQAEAVAAMCRPYRLPAA